MDQKGYTREKTENVPNKRLIDEYKVMKEHELYRNGIYAMPTSSHLVWNCILFIRGGHYKKGKFKLKLIIPEDYPESNVKAYFQTKVYHPMINIETGEVDLRLFPKAHKNTIERTLLFIKSIFTDEKALEKTTSYNAQAGEKYKNDPSFFIRQAKASVDLTEDNNLNDLNFTTFEHQRHNYDIRELTSNIIKCTGQMEDKISVLIDNIMNTMPTQPR